MRRKITLYSIFVMLLFISLPTKAQVYLPFVSYTPSFEVTHRNLSQVILDDGIYELPVEYRSNSTNYERYTLDVQIRNDQITRIYFGNGGSVHNGTNNSGYIWSGGGIRWNVDYYGNIIGGEAIIYLKYTEGRWQLFTISF